MREFRFNGTNVIGEPVRGTVFAPSKKKAKKRIDTLSNKHEFALDAVEERQVYIYKVRHPSGRTVKGEQKAYAKEEVRAALEKMDLEVLSVKRKLLNFQFKPSGTDLVMFVRLAANMLRRKVPFDEVLNLLATDVSSNSLKQVIRDLSRDLKSGMDARQAFMKQQHILGKFTAYMLGLATASGNVAEIFEATARYLERKDEFKKNVRSALITPSVTLLAAIAAFIWFVWDLIPDMIGLFSGFNIELPPFTRASLAFANWMDHNYVWVFALILGSIAGLIWFSRTTKGRFYIHKYMIRIPVIGSLLHKLNLEIFCRVFGVLYSGSGQNQEVMKIAAEATGNTYIERQVKTITIPAMMARGTDLIQAMEASGAFLPMTIARFRSGAESGSVKESADEMAEFYEKETTLKLETTLETIKTTVAIIISILVGLLTVISAETALIQPSASDIMFGG